MEMTFYEEQCKDGTEISERKRYLKLDLYNGGSKSKKPRLNPSLQDAPVLSSPDISKLKLASPELEKLIFDSHDLPTPTPNAETLFPRSDVTEEQEKYARGFEDALNNLRHNDSSQGPLTLSGSQPDINVRSSSASNSSTGTTYVNLETHYSSLPRAGHGFSMSPQDHIVIKDEPQTVPSLNSPPVSPIDMEDQERIKLERKRQRNRVAASKCRRRKLERIARLEDKVKLLKNENTELGGVLSKLKEQVCHLKQQVLEHLHSGCPMPQFENSVLGL